MRYFFLLCFLLGSYGYLFAQEEFDSDIIHDQEWSGGALLHTKGIGITGSFAQKATYKRYTLYELGLYTLNHQKKQRRAPLDNEASPYIYGLANQVFLLRSGFGIRKIIAHQQREEGLRISVDATVGPSLAMLKPVYYDIVPLDNPRMRITEKFDPLKHNQLNIEGAAPFTKGFDELKILYGASAKAALNFQWSHYGYRFYGLEIGMLVDGFPARLKHFAVVEGADVNRALFANPYVTISYGFRK